MSKQIRVFDIRKKLLLPFISLSFLIFGIGFGGLQLKLADIAQEFNLDYTAMGALVMMLYFGILSVSVISGYLGDKFGKKRVMVLAFILYICGAMFAAFSRNVAGLYIGVYMIGLGAGMAECAATAALSDSHPEKAIKKINISQGIYCAGYGVGPFAISAMVSAGAGWRVLFIAPAIIIIALLPFLKTVEFTIREPKGGHKLESLPFFTLLRSKLLVLLLIGVLIYMGLEAGVTYFMDSFFTVELGQQEFSATALTLFWFSMTLTRMIFGVINANTRIVVKLMTGITSVLLALLSLSDHANMAFVVCIITGFTLGTVWPMLIGAATRRYSSNSGTVAGILMTGSGMGGMGIPVLMGVVADYVNLRWSMFMLFLISIVAFVCCFLIFRDKEFR